MQNSRLAFALLVIGFTLPRDIRAQDSEGFSWKMGPVDIGPGRSAKLIFANPFCPNQLMKIDATLAITDLSGQVLQLRASGSDPVPARKRAIVGCNESI